LIAPSARTRSAPERKAGPRPQGASFIDKKVNKYSLFVNQNTGGELGALTSQAAFCLSFSIKPFNFYFQLLNSPVSPCGA
jgi:hypothetical protein